MQHDGLRRQMVAACRSFAERGLSHGTSGNLSVRVPEGLLITPSAVPYRLMEPQDIVLLRADGTWQGPLKPSSEWRIHRDVLAARPEVGAVVHTHSTAATALACHHRGIPAFHYMVAVAGGADIRCAPYATFGTAALSEAALAALTDRMACLLAHHGQVALGPTLEAALALAVEVETLALQYLAACQLGPPPLLDGAEMARVLAAFRDYRSSADTTAPSPSSQQRG